MHSFSYEDESIDVRASYEEGPWIPRRARWGARENTAEYDIFRKFQTHHF